jgi:ribosomal protein S6
MENYELTLVMPGKSKSKEKSIKEKIEKLVQVFEGKIAKADSWGEMELAYIIKKEKTGFFLYFELELPKPQIKKLNEKLRSDGDFIRYLLIRKD